MVPFSEGWVAHQVANATVFTVDVSVIIVNWNTRDILRDCLWSFVKLTHNIVVEVFVVDNASTGGSVEMVSAEFPQVIVNLMHVTEVLQNCGLTCFWKRKDVRLFSFLGDNSFSGKMLRDYIRKSEK